MERWLLYFWTYEPHTPAPFQYWRSKHNEPYNGKMRYFLVAIVVDNSKQRAWNQVFRCFPDYAEYGAVRTNASVDELMKAQAIPIDETTTDVRPLRC